MTSFYDFLDHYYLWIKAFHLIAVIAWMAGLFYLPRLFVYHVETSIRETRETFVVMEARLYKIIMQPAMHLTLTLGILLAMVPGTWSSPWLHAKLAAVFLLVLFHFFLNTCRKELAEGRCRFTGKFFRIINEIPTLLLIIIVIFAIVKPF